MNSRQLCKPETGTQVCITFENSPSPLSVFFFFFCQKKDIFMLLLFLLFSPGKTKKKWLLLNKTISCTYPEFYNE